MTSFVEAKVEEKASEIDLQLLGSDMLLQCPF